MAKKVRLMSVKFKTILISFISAIFIILFTTSIFNFIISGYITKVENKIITNSFEILDSIINKEEANMKKTALDWAHWDDTYHFLSEKNDTYIESNLQYNTLTQLNLNLMFFVDTEGNIIYSKTLDLEDKTKDLLLPKLLDKANKMDEYKTNYDAQSGVLFVSGKLFIITISPITTSDEKAKSNGNLIIGKYVDEPLLNYINTLTRSKITFDEIVAPTAANYNISVNNNNDYISATKQLKDIKGNNSLVSTISMKRDVYKDKIYYLKAFIFSFSITVIIIIFIDVFITNKCILKRLRKLYKFIENVAKTKDTSARIQLSGNDEIYKIANSTNRMLCELDLLYKDMKIMDERFRTIMESTSDGYLDFNVKTKELYISPGWKKFIGYRATDGFELSLEYLDRIPRDSLRRLKYKYYLVVNGKNDYFEEEYDVIKSSGDVIWVLHRGKVSKRSERGKPLRIISTLVDITSRKKYEQEILFLSYSDRLTGLRNREYIEKKFKELDNDPKISYSIIMGDLNGLKLTNDTFGHNEGDRLLCAIANILKNVCEEDDIIGRWGGDEFIILVLNKKPSYVSNLIENIKSECAKVNDFTFNLSIALGSVKKDELANAEAAMGLAEERMYRNKLTEARSSSNSTISSLLKTLHEKHSETEEHTQRIKNLSVRLGKKLGLSQDKLDELELLSVLHDIGKIGISGNILMKPGKLTKEEWEIMKKHTEIGYRIAKSAPRLAHVADEILCHHERFDGTGYPKGLKGEEIPLLSRIINIVDSFDVMTHSRCYKEASSVEYAIEELKRCSGTQFDPVIAEIFIKLLVEEKIHLTG
jgi:diguanylate cyclase (GGDEF)-like protein/PAS domain S-box-containing protein